MIANELLERDVTDAACCCHPQARANDTLTELECFMVDCREMALELAATREELRRERDEQMAALRELSNERLHRVWELIRIDRNEGQVARRELSELVVSEGRAWRATIAELAALTGFAEALDD